MPESKRRTFDAAFKVAAVKRMAAGENVSELARELSVRRKLLYEWRDAVREGRPLLSAGRPRAGSPERAKRAGKSAEAKLAAAHQRIAELERKIGQQQQDLDFFKQALRQVGRSRQEKIATGVPASTPSSKR